MKEGNIILRTTLVVIAAGLIVAAWVLLLRGEQSLALLVLAIESVFMILYWWHYLARGREADAKEKRE